ncbi:sensor histidine kinase [Micromonospora sp. SL1-18]|uniref:sensor histidine kinase n=1 Tax=Micromonospora sp. SL1-18 TaxID=3399128 RepID=UPI003A4DF340
MWADSIGPSPRRPDRLGHADEGCPGWPRLTCHLWPGCCSSRTTWRSVLAEDTGREVTLDLAPGPLPVGVTDELAAAVDALLGNVFAHTPDGMPFTVRLAPYAGQVTLTVADAGPGIPAGPLGRGASHTGSTGLGLDIADRAARASGGRLELHAGPGGGALVLLRLGPPAALTRP